MMALDQVVRQVKALYVGISNYPADMTIRASKILKELGTPCLIHQPKYSMFERWVEDGLLSALDREGIGCIPFSPLAQGLLTDKYLNGIPEGSRASKSWGFLKPEQVGPALEKVKKLNELAKQREQSLAQMALVWLLKDPRITSVLIGASSVEQLRDNVLALNNMKFSNTELDQIENILSDGKPRPQIDEGKPKTRAIKEKPATLLTGQRAKLKALEEKYEQQNPSRNEVSETSSRADFMKDLAKKFGPKEFKPIR
jgi:L-glyceraldehyde 3-phosphate reductase